MGKFFVRFSDLLTPSERERLAELKNDDIPQHVRYDVNDALNDHLQDLFLCNDIAAYICLGEPLERKQVVTALLQANQKKSRRKKAMLGFLVILFWCFALYGLFKLGIWLEQLVF